MSRLSEVDAVVLGGDRHTLDQPCGHRRLAPLFAHAEPKLLEIAA